MWGADYISLFLEVCVPNQLSPRNLATLPPGSRYRIFTIAQDVPRLSADPRLDDIRRVVPVDVVAIDMTEADGHSRRVGTIANAHKRMIACHRRAAADAAAAKHGLIFLVPDCVISEGTIETLLALHRRGARAVVSTGMRLALESFVEAQRRESMPAALPPRELVRVAMQHLHPSTIELMSDGNTDYRTAVYWPVRSATSIDGVLIRTFTLHPLLVDPVLRHELPGGPVDSHYVRHCVPDIHDVHVVEDSDEIALFELTTARRVVGKQRRGGRLLPRMVAGSAQWDSHQVSHWQRAIHIHAAPIDARWQAIDRESAALAATVERYRPVAPALVIMYRLFKSWRRRDDAARTAALKLRKRAARGIRVTAHRVSKTLETTRKALRPAVSGKQVARPVRLLWHRGAKVAKQGMKRMRRRMRALLPA